MNSIELPQGPIHYDDVGHGSPVVFVHGILANGQLWRKVVPTLSRSARCIVPDWPLGSHSTPMAPNADLSVEGMARLVSDFLEALDLRNVTLVGNDSGGAISQVVAARHRKRIGRLVLTTCDAYEVFPPPLFAYLKLLPVVPGLTAVLSKSLLHFPALRRLPVAYGLLTKTPIPDDILTQYIRPCATSAGIRRDLEKFARSASSRITMQVAEELKSFPHPTLLLWTPEDRLLPISLAERLAEAIPNARLVPIEDARIFVSEDQPVRVAEEIARFIGTEASIASQASIN